MTDIVPILRISDEALPNAAADEIERLRKVEKAAADLAQFVYRSLNVGPLTKDPSREAKLWGSLREALQENARPKGLRNPRRLA